MQRLQHFLRLFCLYLVVHSSLTLLEVLWKLFFGFLRIIWYHKCFKFRHCCPLMEKDCKYPKQQETEMQIKSKTKKNSILCSALLQKLTDYLLHQLLCCSHARLWSLKFLTLMVILMPMSETRGKQSNTVCRRGHNT